MAPPTRDLMKIKNWTAEKRLELATVITMRLNKIKSIDERVESLLNMRQRIDKALQEELELAEALGVDVEREMRSRWRVVSRNQKGEGL